MSADSNRESDGPRRMPSDPMQVESLRCLSCESLVRPTLVAVPAGMADTDAFGSPDVFAEYDVEAEARFNCPACGQSIEKELSVFDRQAFGTDVVAEQSFEVAVNRFEGRDSGE